MHDGIIKWVKMKKLGDMSIVFPPRPCPTSARGRNATVSEAELLSNFKNSRSLMLKNCP
jgi:hypothetical protein